MGSAGLALHFARKLFPLFRELQIDALGLWASRPGGLTRLLRQHSTTLSALGRRETLPLLAVKMRLHRARSSAPRAEPAYSTTPGRTAVTVLRRASAETRTSVEPEAPIGALHFTNSGPSLQMRIECGRTLTSGE